MALKNSITDKEVDQIKQLEAQALMIAELANSMQEQSQKQFKNDGVVQGDTQRTLTYSNHSQGWSRGETEEEMPTLRAGGVPQARSMLQTCSQRRQTPCGMDKQEKHLKVRGGQVHRGVAARQG